MPGGLADLPTLAFGFMLVIARVGSAMLAGPALGETELPAQVRIGLAAIVALLVYPAVQQHLPVMPPGFGDVAVLLLLEIGIGLWIGLLARLIVLSLSMAGGMLSLSVGLSNVLQLDPTVGGQTPALERMLSLAAIALLFATHLYLYPLQAAIGSYEMFAPGSAPAAGDAAQLVVTATAASFGLALRLSAPFIVGSIVWNAALGMLNRLVPQIHVFMVSTPAQIFGGIALLAAALTSLFAIWLGEIGTQFAALPGL